MNEHEQKLYDILSKQGFTVLRRGWPDFLVVAHSGGEWSDGRYITKGNPRSAFAVELKNGYDKLSNEQAEMHKMLKLLGVPVLTVKNDFTDLLKKRGRIFVAPMTKTVFVERLSELENKIQNMMYEYKKLVEQLDASTALLDQQDIGTRFSDPSVMPGLWR